ncbi:MAG: AIPR family protein [Planctomycetes bacterium]|nr:AIPR family protein [Planctomycetota bacterium]
MSNINVSIIDQRVGKLAQEFASEFAERLNIKNDVIKQRSAAFVFLVVQTVLDIPDDEALDCLTEGGNDFGVDAIHVGDIQDGEFAVTLFQGKYKQNLDGDSAFPENGVTKVIQAVRYLFDPSVSIQVNKQLLGRVEEIRSFVRDGEIPQVRVILCNNGQKWNTQAQDLINAAGFGTQVTWDHMNHDDLIGIMQSAKSVDDTLRLSGKALIEEFDFRRVLVGKIPVTELASLFERHGDRLLERNIRRYLGLTGNRVNEAINKTLNDSKQQSNFYFYNNGITLICSKFSHNALQGENYQVKVEALQVINGGQTCKTIQKSLADRLPFPVTASVLLRLYELPGEEQDLVRSITYATNSQNPVDLRDLRSNDDRQRLLETSISELGYQYRRQRGDFAIKSTDITSATAAEAVLSVWRKHPNQARFRSREHFGKLYDEIFTSDLNGAQVVIATLVYRIAENKRRRPPNGAPEFLPYASCFLAMLMGQYLLKEIGIPLGNLDHRNFKQAKVKVEEKGEEYFEKAVEAVHDAILRLYGVKQISILSLQRLSATFRRGDLIQELGVK